MGIYSTETSFEGNSISRELFVYLLDNLPQRKTILELGSGWGSGELIKHWNVWSVENSEKWFKMYNPQSVLIPIKNGWYDFDMMNEFMRRMRGNYDLLLVDGPYDNRKGILQNFHMFDHDPRIPVVFDDIARKEGLDIIDGVSQRLNRTYEIFGGNKFGVIR